MTNPLLISLAAVAASTLTFVAGSALMIRLCYRKPPPGHALVVRKSGDLFAVSLTGGLVLPTIHRGDFVDLTVKQLVVERRGDEAIYSKDDVPVEVRVTCQLHVAAEPADIRIAFDRDGARAGALETMRARFEPKIGDAVRTVIRSLTFDEADARSSELKQTLRAAIGADLGGYSLDDVSIDLLRRRA